MSWIDPQNPHILIVDAKAATPGANSQINKLFAHRRIIILIIFTKTLSREIHTSTKSRMNRLSRCYKAMVLVNIIRMMVLRCANSSFIWLLAPGVAALVSTIKT